MSQTIIGKQHYVQIVVSRLGIVLRYSEKKLEVLALGIVLLLILNIKQVV